MMTRLELRKIAVLAAGALLTLVTAPVVAERSGSDATPASEVITARVIGFMCAGSLEAGDIYDLDLYLSWKRLAEARTDGATARKEWMVYPDMEAQVMATYREPTTCTADATTMARRTVARVRRDVTNACALDGCFDP